MLAGQWSIRGGSGAAAISKMEHFVIIVNGFQPLTIITKYSILDVAAALDPTTGCSHWKKRILKLFGNIRMVCFVSTEQQNLFQKIPSIWHWNKQSMLMQPIRELVLLRWLTRYQHGNVGLNPIFSRTTIISYLNEDLNLTKKEDITESLKASNTNKVIWQWKKYNLW